VDRINTIIAVAPTGSLPGEGVIEKLDIPVKITAGAIIIRLPLEYGRANRGHGIMRVYRQRLGLMSLASMSNGMAGGMVAAWVADTAAWAAAWGRYGGGGGYGGGYGAMGGLRGRQRSPPRGLNRANFAKDELPGRHADGASANPMAAGSTPTSLEATWE